MGETLQGPFKHFNCFYDHLQEPGLWFLIPWLVPHLGGLAGGMLYKFLIKSQNLVDDKDNKKISSEDMKKWM